ncbi:MAG: hypothetical protein K6G12_10240 [Lachnospiraceae bacterium]|nr:hypothetical protein [Lachnospiraceae bacterium]
MSEPSKEREIGSEFEIYSENGDTDLLSEIEDKAKHQGKYTHYIRCGRDALGYIADDIIERYGNKRGNRKEDITVFMPALSCDSMVRPFTVRGLDLKYYRLEEDLNIDTGHLTGIMDTASIPVVLMMDHFGLTDMDASARSIKEHRKDAVLIVDVTQTVFDEDKYLSKESEADYVCGSIRKWLGVPDGAVVISDRILKGHISEGESDFCSFRLEALNDKKRYIDDSMRDKALKTIFRRKLSDAEESLDDGKNPLKISGLSAGMLSHIDERKIISIRRQNFKTLVGLFKDAFGYETYYRFINDTGRIPECPFMLPVVIDIDRIRNDSANAAGRSITRDRFEQKLASCGVYAPVLWPIDAKAAEVCGNSKYFADNMLAFYIDQRYDEEDMRYTVEVFEDKLREILGTAEDNI